MPHWFSVRTNNTGKSLFSRSDLVTFVPCKLSLLFLQFLPCDYNAQALILMNKPIVEEYGFLGCDAVYFGRIRTFRRNLSLRYSAWQASCLNYSSTLKMEAMLSSKTSVCFLITRPLNPIHCNLQSHRCGSLKSKSLLFGSQFIRSESVRKFKWIKDAAVWCVET
jgi:hypothetical protein